MTSLSLVMPRLKKMIGFVKTITLLIICFFLYSCNESAHVDFHSYQELSEYDFINNGWFPEILKDDAYMIQETFDIGNKQLFGKFDFKNRSKYDSIIHTYHLTDRDSLINHIGKINKPIYPDWFVSKENININNFILGKGK
ncbi:MAG: hypothetical protein ACM339_11815 [Ignavibacteria bacterium]